MRIIAGRFRGTALAAPADNSIRPTSDRVREALFNILAHGDPPLELADARVLDLFAGTGALGFEALSRGAKACVFVDNAAQSRALIRRNMEALGVTGMCKLLRRDATHLGAPERLGSFDLVFLDPPYGKGLAEPALSAAIANDWLAPGARIVLEEEKSAEIGWPDGVTVDDERAYGDTRCWFARWDAA